MLLISSFFDSETEDEAAVVDIIEERLAQLAVETHVELVEDGNSTRDRGATSARFGPFPVYTCIDMHALHGLSTSTPRSLPLICVASEPGL